MQEKANEKVKELQHKAEEKVNEFIDGFLILTELFKNYLAKYGKN